MAEVPHRDQFASVLWCFFFTEQCYIFHWDQWFSYMRPFSIYREHVMTEVSLCTGLQMVCSTNRADINTVYRI